MIRNGVHIMSKAIIIILLIVIFGFIGVFYYYPPQEVVLVEPVLCTTEAKICSDGSSVVRTGPSCEFAECPVPVPVVEVKEEGKAALNQKIFNNGIFVTPLEVTSDSRCPSDVTCVWAGEISLKTRLEKGTTTADVVFKQQSAVVFEGYSITLTDVIPANNSKTPLSKAEYRFTFTVTPLAQMMVGSVSGRVTLSPICPVERVPQEPQCSPKPYATTIEIKEAGKGVVMKTVQSDNMGVFKIDLPVGTYVLHALTVNNAPMPSCAPVNITIKSGQVTTQDISCDTGIR